MPALPPLHPNAEHACPAIHALGPTPALLWPQVPWLFSGLVPEARQDAHLCPASSAPCLVCWVPRIHSPSPTAGYQLRGLVQAGKRSAAEPLSCVPCSPRLTFTRAGKANRCFVLNCSTGLARTTAAVNLPREDSAPEEASQRLRVRQSPQIGQLPTERDYSVEGNGRQPTDTQKLCCGWRSDRWPSKHWQTWGPRAEVVQRRWRGMPPTFRVPSWRRGCTRGPVVPREVAQTGTGPQQDFPERSTTFQTKGGRRPLDRPQQQTEPGPRSATAWCARTRLLFIYFQHVVAPAGPRRPHSQPEQLASRARQAGGREAALWMRRLRVSHSWILTTPGLRVAW